MTTLLIVIIAALVICAFILSSKLAGEKKQLDYIVSVLNDIEQGNTNRRVLAFDNDMTSNICFKINAIVDGYKQQFVQSAHVEQANRQIMTSLSHDVKTPLTSLLGYVDAIHSGVVLGEEKDSYIETAWRKAYDLKEYIDTLFDWFKLNSNEWQFNFEAADINEFTRTIIIDWIPVFENNGFDYGISIEEKELILQFDAKAYTRIINNLVNNAVLHSGGSLVQVGITHDQNHVSVSVVDNGKGIPQSSIPYIFDRLYKQDEARNSKGSGLGLAIAQELVKAHNGTLSVASVAGERTVFTAQLPLARC